MAIRTPKEAVILNEDPIVSTAVSKDLRQVSFLNTDVDSPDNNSFRTLYQDSTGVVESGTPTPSEVDIVRSPTDTGEVVSVYKTDGDIFVTNLEQVYKQQFTYALGDSGVERIIAGTNVTVSSTGPDGTGVVTVSSTGSTTTGVISILAGNNISIGSTGPGGSGIVTINAVIPPPPSSVTRIIAGNNVSISSTIPGGLGDVTINSSTSLIDNYATITGATGVVVHNYNLGPVFYHQGVVANFTVNLTNFSLAANQSTGITVTIQQGATPYIPSALQIGGVAQTILWQGGVIPTGNANKTDFVGFTFFGTPSGYRVYGQLVTFG